MKILEEKKKGKHHNDESKSLISKPGKLNPMFGKSQALRERKY